MIPTRNANIILVKEGPQVACRTQRPAVADGKVVTVTSESLNKVVFERQDFHRHPRRLALQDFQQRRQHHGDGVVVREDPEAPLTGCGVKYTARCESLL